MSAFMHTGVAGFNPRPNPHNAPFWDMQGASKNKANRMEQSVLTGFLVNFGPAGPQIGWLELESNTFRTMLYLQQPQDEYLQEKTKEPGVMSRLQPRETKNDGTLLHTNHYIAAKYFPEDFPELASYTMPASQCLNAEEAKEKNLYYPNQPGIIMAAPLVPSRDFPKRRGGNGHGPRLDLIRLLGSCQEIKEQIINDLDYNSKAALFQTCLAGAKAVSESSILLNTGTQWFGGNEYTLEEFNGLKKAGLIPKKVEQRGSKYVTLSNTHNDWDEDHKVRTWSSYERYAAGLCRAFRYFDLVGHYVRQVTITGLPFLDVYGLAAICDLCPHLEKCSVLKNEQIKFHELPQFFNNYVCKKNRRSIEFDIAPLYETGPRWKNESRVGVDSTSRQGTFGITHTDSGIKTNVAIVQACIYNLFPALKSAKQEHMIYRPSSLLRQWLEAQALPVGSITRTIAVFEAKEKRVKRIAQSKKAWIEWNEFHPPQWIPEYDESKWPENLHEYIANADVETSFMMAKAMFGDEMWVETFDRGTRSNNYRCRVDNWDFWAKKVRCTECNQAVEHMCYAASYTCEYCRLQDWINSERDHLKQIKLRATDALGFKKEKMRFGKVIYLFSTLAESNFPKSEKFKMRDGSGNLVPIIRRPGDFLSKVMNHASSSLHEFFDAALDMDRRSTRQGIVGHCSAQQKVHDYSDHPPLHGVTWQDMLKFAAYRRAPTKEEYELCGATGWTPEHGQGLLMW